MSLNLRGNPISTVKTRSFHRLEYLKKLDLSECEIATVESGAFEGLQNLQRIYLDGNRLKVLDSRDLPPSLHGITAHDNR